MFSIISIMFLGIGIGYLLRNLKFLEKVEKSTSLTIFLLLFVLGLSIGSNSLIVNIWVNSDGKPLCWLL